MVDVRKSILYLDDEINNLVSFNAAFRKHFEIFTAQNIQEALEILKNKQVSIILADQRMNPVNGVDFFKSIKDTYPLPIRMIITGYADVFVLIDALNSGIVYQYLLKPINEFDLFFSIERALEVYWLRRQVEELESRLLTSK